MLNNTLWKELLCCLFKFILDLGLWASSLKVGSTRKTVRKEVSHPSLRALFSSCFVVCMKYRYRRKLVTICLPLSCIRESLYIQEKVYMFEGRIFYLRNWGYVEFLALWVLVWMVEYSQVCVSFRIYNFFNHYWEVSLSQECIHSQI